MPRCAREAPSHLPSPPHQRGLTGRTARGTDSLPGAAAVTQPTHALEHGAVHMPLELQEHRQQVGVIQGGAFSAGVNHARDHLQKLVRLQRPRWTRRYLDFHGKDSLP